MATSVWQAMTGSPVRFARSGWPWRSLAFVVSSVAVSSIAWLAVLPLLLFPPLLLLVGIPIGALERHRLGLMEPRAVPDPHAPAPVNGWAWVRLRVTESATWRELGYCACLLTVLALLDLAALLVLFVGLLLLTLPLLLALGAEAHVQVGTWTVETFGQACAVAGLAGAPATIVTLYGISVLAAPRLPSPDGCLHRTAPRCTARWRNWPSRAAGWSTPSTPNVVGSSETCTTAPSNTWCS